MAMKDNTPISSSETWTNEDVLYSTENSRTRNAYLKFGGAEEKERLNSQISLMLEFSGPVYARLLASKHDLAILDVGCNDGTYLACKFAACEEVSHVLGIDMNEKVVSAANEHLGSNVMQFRHADCESEQLKEVLDDYLRNIGRTGFDLIVMSMVVLHLKDPLKVLAVLHDYLADGGVVVIEDIDDGLNTAYPDPEGRFERAFKSVRLIEYVGYRMCGRQILGYLSKAGFSSVQLERTGISTAGMDSSEKQALFDLCFPAILRGLELMKENYPLNEEVATQYAWFTQNYKLIEKEYESPDFFMLLGFMLFTARK